MGNALGNFKEYWDEMNSNPRMLGGFIWDWVDQGIALNEKLGMSNEKWFSIPKDAVLYGGDFGDKPNLNAFCMNGIVMSDRTLTPKYYEVQAIYGGMSEQEIAQQYPEASVPAPKPSKGNHKVQSLKFKVQSKKNMEQTMKGYLFRLLNHEELSREEMKTILIGITQSEYPNEQITALLTCLQMRGVSVDELLGFRDGILETGVPAILQADRYIDVVGTGGDRKNTFNISTTACFVIAGAGYKVAKHGNYAATSVSGASNVIQHHGIKFTDDIDKLNRSLNEAGIVYLHAQLFAKAMKFVGPIRKALQFPTIFNLLGPIVNPSQPKCQLLGVANLDQMRLYSQVYQKLGIDYGIVNSIDGYDEISLTGDFKVTTKDYERIFSPKDLGFDIAKPEELVGGATEEEAAQIFDSVLENRALPAQKNIVLANAAFGIQVLEKGQKSIEECIEIARESIDSGSALRTFKKFVELNS
jgi:anthranilate phosphoribosyltransferase